MTKVSRFEPPKDDKPFNPADLDYNPHGEPFETAEMRAREGYESPQGGPSPRKPKMETEWFNEAADSALNEPANPLIEDFLDEGALSVFYGDSGGGKTFGALDMAFHVAAGLDWNGKGVKHGLVVYIAAEGGKRIKRRIAALKKRYLDEHGNDAPQPLFALVRYQIDLRSSNADLDNLIALVRDAEEKTGEKCVWLIVDTLSRAMAGGDENSPVDMGRIVAAADRFRAEIGAHFTYVHHTGKDAARGARGHSLLRAATDTEVEFAASSLTLTKQRDGELGFQIAFELIDVVIGKDPDGLWIKSAVVSWKAGQMAAPNKKPKVPPRGLRMLISVVKQALDESETPPIRPFADGPLIKAVADEVVRYRYYLRIAENPKRGETAQQLADRQRSSFNYSVNTALKSEDLMACNIDGIRCLWIGKER
jgi:hypothetical protein